jgi:hypothetical protein
LALTSYYTDVKQFILKLVNKNFISTVNTSSSDEA